MLKKRLNRRWVSDTVINHSDTGALALRAKALGLHDRKIQYGFSALLQIPSYLTNEIFLNGIPGPHFKL
jgi:hypothetical protein